MPDKTRKTISATQIAALFGASKYETRFMLYHWLAGADIEKETDNRMDAGNRLEGAILTWAAEDLGVAKLHINRDASGEQTYFRRGLIGCHRDADIFDPDKGMGALETKCIFDFRVLYDEWGGGKTPPRMHELQLQAQMYVGDGEKPFTWGVLTGYCAGQLEHYHRTPMPELWDAMEREAESLFEDVALGNEPDPTGLNIELPLLNKLFPPQQGTVLDLSQIIDSTDEEVVKENLRRIQFLELARSQVFHSESKNFHEKAAKDAQTKLRALALGNEVVKLPFGANVTIKQSGRKGFTVEPTTITTTKVYVPENLPNIEDVPGLKTEIAI